MQAVLHGLVDGQEEVVFAEQLGKAAAPEDVEHERADAGEDQVAAAVAQVMGQAHQRLGRGHVEVGGRLHVPHHDARLGPRVAQQLVEAVDGEARVGEEELAVEAKDEQAGEGLVLGMASGVAVGRGVGHAAQLGGVRAARAVDQHGQREPHGDPQAGQHAQGQHTHEGGQRGHGVDGAHAGKAPQGLHVDQAPDGAHHDGAEDGFGQVVSDPGDREHRGDHDGGADQAGELGAGAGGVVQRRPRQAAAHHDAAEGSRADVRQAQGDQLLVGVDLVAVPHGERAGAGQGLGVDHDGDAGGAGQQAEGVGEVDVGQMGQRQAARDRAHHGDPVGAQVKDRRGDDAEYKDGERRRHPGPAPQDEQQRQGHGAHQRRHQARAAQVGEVCPDRPEEVGVARHVQPQELGHLAGDDGEREAGDVARDHRARQERRDEPQPRDAGEQAERADEHGHRGHEGGRLGGAGGAVGGHHRRGHDGGGRGGRTGELARGAEDRVDDEGGQGRVQAGLGRHAGDLRVGHALGQQQADHGEGGDGVVAQPAPLIPGGPLCDRQQAVQPRVPHRVGRPALLRLVRPCGRARSAHSP